MHNNHIDSTGFWYTSFMSNERFTLRAAVYLILIKDGKTLLSRRFNTGWLDGWKI